MKNYAAEFIGTFALVFFAAGSAIVNELYGGQLGLSGCATASGLIVIAMIYTFENVSGAHINPAVTIGFSLAGMFNRKEILPYIFSQLLGSLVAGFCLRFLFPATKFAGATLPTATGEMQAFVLEIILTFFLMLVILHTSQGIREVQQLAGFIIGGVVLLEILLGEPVAGGSMNPARSLGPAVASGHINSLWIYFVAPVFGSGLAVPVWEITKPA